MKNSRLYLLNLYFYFFFIVYSVAYIPVMTLVLGSILLFMSKRFRMKRCRRAISWYGRGITFIPYPFIRLIYENHSKGNTKEPYIFVCNHRAASDAFLMSVLPHEAVEVVNIWPFRIPVLGFFARKAGYLNIRMMKPEAFFEKASELLRENVSIIFFPEGTRSAGREMGNFHGSAFRLALKSRASIVPLCISGNENVPPKGSFLLRPGTIRIRRLPAITWKDYKEMSVFSLKNKVREVIGNELSLMESAV
jgi:1-acyl-sn-glycerol-3-phosphate acyltransferase